MRTFIPTGHFLKKVKAIERSLFPDIKAIDLDDFLGQKKKKKRLFLKRKMPAAFSWPIKLLVHKVNLPMNKLSMDGEINHLTVYIFFFVTVILLKKAIIFCANGSVLLDKTYMLLKMYRKLHLFQCILFSLANNFLRPYYTLGHRYKYLRPQVWPLRNLT